jgi:hypothetical protein
MDPFKWKIYTEPLLRYGLPGHRMYILRGEPSGRFSVVTDMVFETQEENSFISEDKATIDDSKHFCPDVRSFLQACADAAWEIGIRPKQIEDHTSELKATKYHLEDMRRLVLDKPTKPE